MDLYANASTEDLRVLLEDAGLDTSRCVAREDLMLLLVSSLKKSRGQSPMRQKSTTFTQRGSRTPRGQSTCVQPSPTRRSQTPRTRMPEQPKTRLATADLGAIMHGYFLGNLQSTKHTVACDVPRYKVDLDAPPEVRWTRILQDYAGQIPAAAQALQVAMEGLELPTQATDFFLASGQASAECAEEVMAVATELSMAPADVVAMQVAYEVLGACTCVVAPSKEGPPLMHRTLDWDIPNMKALTIEVDFQRGGRSVFIGTTWAGYLGVATGMRPGAFAGAVNRRPGLPRRTPKQVAWPAGLLLRKVLEDEENFAGAVAAISSAPLIAPCFVTLCGSKPGEGVIISRLEDKTDAFQRLDPFKKPNFTLMGTKVTPGNCLVATNSDAMRVFSQDPAAPVSEDMHREVLINACLATVLSGTFSLEELWNVCSTDAVVGPSTVYQTSMCPVVGEYTTRVQVSPEMVGQANDQYRGPREEVRVWQEGRLRMQDQQLDQTTKMFEVAELEERHYLVQAVSQSRPAERREMPSERMLESRDSYYHSRLSQNSRVGGGDDPMSISSLHGAPAAPKPEEKVADIGRGNTWKCLKAGRVPSGGLIGEQSGEEPRWPASQLSVRDADAAGRMSQMNLAQLQGTKKYRFGGEVDPASIGNVQHRLNKSWRSAPTHSPGGSFSFCRGGLSGRSRSPTRSRSTAPERPRLLQESSVAYDTVREFEKSVLALAYHGRVMIFKGGEDGASVTPSEIRSGYGLADSDFVDYGGMVASRQAEAMFGDQSAAVASMRPHSGFAGGERSYVGPGPSQVLPYQQYPDQAYQRHLEGQYTPQGNYASQQQYSNTRRY